MRFEVTGAAEDKRLLACDAVLGEWFRRLQGPCRSRIQGFSSPRTLFSLLLFGSGCFISCSKPKTLRKLEFHRRPYLAPALNSGDVAGNR